MLKYQMPDARCLPQMPPLNALSPDAPPKRLNVVRCQIPLPDASPKCSIARYPSQILKRQMPDATTRLSSILNSLYNLIIAPEQRAIL
jgi:hypothetical protein